jgi:hypothetical protein
MYVYVYVCVCVRRVEYLLTWNLSVQATRDHNTLKVLFCDFLDFTLHKGRNL